MTIRFSLKSRPSERFHRPEMSQIKAEIHLRTNVKLNFHKNVGLKAGEASSRRQQKWTLHCTGAVLLRLI